MGGQEPEISWIIAGIFEDKPYSQFYLEEFVEKSFLLDTRGNILGNTSAMLGKEKATDVISKNIKDTTYDCNFIPETVERALEEGYKPPYYRNGFLCHAMKREGIVNVEGTGHKARWMLVDK